MGTTLMSEPTQGKKTGGQKKQPTTTMKAHVRFSAVVGQLAKLRDISIPDALDLYLERYEDDLLTELATRKAAIEQSRRK